jgi:hypothetical protein
MKALWGEKQFANTVAIDEYFTKQKNLIKRLIC